MELFDRPVPHALEWIATVGGVVGALLMLIAGVRKLRDGVAWARDKIALRTQHSRLRRIAQIKRRMAQRQEALKDPIKMTVYMGWITLTCVVAASMMVIFTGATVAIIVMTSFDPPTGVTAFAVLLLQITCMTGLWLGILVQGSVIGRHTDLRNPKASDERDEGRLVELERRATEFLLS